MSLTTLRSGSSPIAQPPNGWAVRILRMGQRYRKLVLNFPPAASLMDAITPVISR